jgi:hypothetical protein
MHTIQIERDINCRTIGRCSNGAHIDRELQDLTRRDRSFDCCREDWEKTVHVPLLKTWVVPSCMPAINADLSAAGLEVRVWRNGTRESAEDGWVDQIENLLQIGERAATSIDLNHFGTFVRGE